MAGGPTAFAPPKPCKTRTSRGVCPWVSWVDVEAEREKRGGKSFGKQIEKKVKSVEARMRTGVGVGNPARLLTESEFDSLQCTRNTVMV